MEVRVLSSALEEYRRFWDDSFDRLDEYLADLQQADKRSPATKHHSKNSSAQTNPPKTK
jgi:hypothetical protein